MISTFIAPDDAMERWAGMRFRSSVLYVPDAGRVRAADALIALRTAAQAHGAQFRYETAVRAVTVLGENLVAVATDDAEYLAARFIVTAGTLPAGQARGGMAQLQPQPRSPFY
ncbi:FAD-dependent oxidoreductase [Arthrobacter sp. TMN-49]